jgi:methyltransferase, FkbM family
MVIDLIRNFVEAGQTIFDVGANIGQKAEFFIEIGAKVICFEPQPHCVEILNQKYGNNPQVAIVNKGLAEHPGEMQLSIASDLNVLSTFSEKWKTGRFAGINWDREITVEISTLDEMIQVFGCPQFCKIDVEGLEYLVLKGLSQPIPCLSFEFTIEFIDDAKKSIAHLETLGYQLFNLAKGEESHLALAEWVSSDRLFECISSFNEHQLWGDIYAKFEPEKLTQSPRGTRFKKREVNGDLLVIKKIINKGYVVFDVGANKGDWTKEVLKQCQDVEIHLFEPLPQTYKTLLLNLAEPLKEGTIIPFNLALAQKEEIKNFYYYEELPVLSTFYRQVDVEKQGGLTPPRAFPILTTTIDSYCQRQCIKRINFLKIDVEGSEFDVIQGAKQLLKDGNIDYIQFEYGEKYVDAEITLKEVFEYLQKYRYSIFKVLPEGLEYKPDFQLYDENFEDSNFLAVNERFRSTVLGQATDGKLDIQKLCQENSITPRGVIHIGAHEGGELTSYQAMGVNKILFIEANPVVFERLQANMAAYPNVQTVNCAISNHNGTIDLRVTSFDQSSSILPLKHHLDIYPNITETHQVTVQSRTIDTLLQELGLNPSDFNILNIDIQGAELLALQGATNWLKYVEAINTEVNYEELYEGCALIDQMDRFLKTAGFDRVATTTPIHPSWGDAIYVKKPTITSSLLGLENMGRLGNQIFLYAFLRTYARQHNLRVETPAWIGQYLFGHHDAPISKPLPLVGEQAQPYKLSESAILNAPEPLKNVDFQGYFQFHTQYHAQHKEYFQSLFKPLPEVAAKVIEALDILRSKGKTIVGLHLRRGDYRSIHTVVPYLTVAPSGWYKEWLDGLWETLDEPVLFIASDEIETVVGDFADYNPITVKDLGVEMPEAPFYPDFYILSQCDVLAISNSTFSFTAAMLNERCKFFFRPNLRKQKMIAFDPWNSEPLLRDNPNDLPATVSQKPIKILIIQEVALISPEDPELLWGFSIDSPTVRNYATPSNILIGGWVIGKKSRAVKVELIRDGEVIRDIIVNQHRPDVAAVFPGVPFAENSGYATEWEITGTLPECEISIQAVLADETRVKFGVVRWQETIYHTPSNNERAKCELSVGAIMKDEAPYLIEWLEFHKIVGVERFYLYNNNSTDNTIDILQPYVQSGEVILHDWPVTPGQMSAYEHCLSAYKNESEWIAFIDLDEFLFPTEKDDLKEVLKEFDGVAGVVVNQLYFGSSGHEFRPEGLQIEHFTKRSADNCDSNKCVKSIVRSQQVLGPSCPHFFIPSSKDRFLVTENREPLSSSISEKKSVQKLRINHYFTRSKQEMKAKVMRGDAFFPWQKALSVLEARDCNEVEDLTIQRFVPRVRQAIDARIQDHISSTISHLLPGESQVVAQYIKAGDIVFDLGANIGAWAKEVLTRHQDIAEIHIFEPLAHVHKNLVDRLRGENNVKILAQNMAVGSREEIKTFYQYDDRCTLSTSDRSGWMESQGGIQPPQECTVFTTTLARYCQRLGIKRINFLKIDVEGAELDVLYGASELLKYGQIDYIQFEYGTTYREANITLKEVCEYLQKYRYSIFKILPQGLEYRPNFQPEHEVFESSNFLAVNDRFRANVLGEPPRLLDVPQLCAQHSITPRGIIHVGAHEGTEIGYYQAMGAQKVLFVEANPAVFERLQANIADRPNVQAVNCAISNKNGTINLHVTSFDQSSSILPLKHHQDIYPDITETHQVTVQSKTIDTLLQELGLDPSEFNILNIDIQGAELLALQGATNWLQYVDAINTEVNYQELYEGCALVHDLDEFLDRHGFERVATTTPHPSWGDGFYVKKPLVTMSILSRARFGNQIFLYAMLKIHEQQQNIRVETSPWIGQYLFGHSEPPISKSLPVVHDSGLGIINAEVPLGNVEFGGPTYQIPTKYYAPHKELFRSLFQPMPEVEAKVAAAVSSLRQRGKTIVGLHLRRGDYWGPYAEFMFIAPNSCYKKWLQGLWETLEEPVLFIASDELEEVVDDFADYYPVTVKDLGVEMPEAPFYPDFYILSQCDVLAISNSTFSVAASMLNERCKFFFRPHLPSKTLIPFDPWDSEPLYWHGSGTWEEEESGYGLVTANQSLEKKSNPLQLKIVAVVDVAPAYPEALEWLRGFNIDSPAIGKVDNSEILMSGWVLGKNARSVAVEFIYNGETLCTTPVGGYRSDVASAFPGVPLAARSAYKAKLDFVAGKQPESEVLIQAVLADETRVKLGLVRLQEVVYHFPLGNQKQKYRMKWFFAINEASPGFEIYSQMIKVAVYTAQQNTSLEPYCIYDGEENELTDWLQKNGVKIIYHRTPHYEKLQTQYPWCSTVAFGAFLRIEIPKIVEIYEIPDEYVFYTDCDVMFFGDVVDYLQGITCEYFAAAPEHEPNNWEYLNSGVLYMNVKNLQKIQKEFDDFIDGNLEQILQLAYDQGAYNLFFKDKWDRLDIQLNWKSYWDFSPEAKIIHFHGPKPTQAEEIRSKTASGTSLLFANGFYWLNTEIWQFIYKKIEELDAGILVKMAECEQFDPQVEETREELAQSQTKLHQDAGGFEQFTTKLQQVQEELQPIKEELELRQVQYQKTQEELAQTKSELIEVQAQLQEMESAAAPLNQLAELYLVQGKLEDAIAVCEQVLKIKPQFAPAYKTLGNVLQAQGKLDEAKSWYIRALEIQPDFAQALANLGTIHAQQQQWQVAIACYQKAIAIQPNFAGVYRNLAKVFSQIGKPDEAVECCYAAAISEPKTTAEEYFNLGNTLLQQGKQERAIVCYRRAIYLNPHFSEAQDKLDELMAVGE